MKTTTSQVECADWLGFVRTLAVDSVDLMYVDPPFATGKKQIGSARDEPRVEASGLRVEQDQDRSLTVAARLEYPDSWDSTQAWVVWLRARLEATLPALKPTGSILVHVDWRTSHHARLLLDELLGADRFVNHLIWRYGLGGSSPRRFARKHDDILLYCIDPGRYFFEPPMVPATSNRMKGELKKATDVIDIPALNNMAHERTGYPTQKPLALLELLIGACCPASGLVLDPCCGSGTTLVAAVKAGRRAIGCDANPDAVRVAQGRLDQD